MTGPEHYREAERIIAEVNAGELDASVLDRSQLLIVAQVHATLALAAATAIGRQRGLDEQAWLTAASTRLSGG